LQDCGLVGGVDILAGLSAEHLAHAFPRGAVPVPRIAEGLLGKCGNSEAVKSLLVQWAFPRQNDRKIGEVVESYTRYLETSAVGSKGADEVLHCAIMRRFFEELDEWMSGGDPVSDRSV